MRTMTVSKGPITISEYIAILKQLHWKQPSFQYTENTQFLSLVHFVNWLAGTGLLYFHRRQILKGKEEFFGVATTCAYLRKRPISCFKDQQHFRANRKKPEEKQSQGGRGQKPPVLTSLCLCHLCSEKDLSSRAPAPSLCPCRGLSPRSFAPNPWAWATGGVLGRTAGSGGVYSMAHGGYWNSEGLGHLCE